MSSTVYDELRRARSHRQPLTARSHVVCFADPDLGRLGVGVGTAGVLGAVGDGLRVLPGARHEASAIASLFDTGAEVFTGSAATEARAKAVGPEAAVVHFAVHGIVDHAFPLDSALLLGADDGADGGGENGILQAWEILEQVRLDAQLVTLSACSSGVGTELAGEGLIGLTRAFQYAGARSVVASLWEVGDASTSVLMSRFYRYLKEGKTKDVALQKAQLDLLRGTVRGVGEPAPSEGDLSHPYFWAAFQLYGDWR
jgi:CHAT domain-containing protein